MSGFVVQGYKSPTKKNRNTLNQLIIKDLNNFEQTFY